MVTVLLDGVSKHYPEETALDGFTLRVEEGEAVVLLGPSGSGKTTVLRLLAGLEKPSGGDILFDGSPVNEVDPNDRNVAMVFQGDVLYPFLEIRDNIGFPLSVRKTPGAERTARVEAEARVHGLQGLLSRRPATLSAGQKRLTQVAKAMVRSPDLFLIDEVFEPIDLTARKSLRSELRLLQTGYGVTAIYATHDQEDAMALADRIVVMDAGRVRQVGEPLTVYHEPADTFVAQFVGSPQMSLLEATGARDGVRLPGLTLPGPPRLPPKVLVGVRPEAWAEGSTGMAGRLIRNTMMGTYRLWELKTEAGFANVRVSVETPDPEATTKFRPLRYHLFDPISGKALFHSD